MFICNHCPFVIHLKKDIVKLSNFYMKVGGNLIRFPFFSNFTYYMHSLLSVSSVVEKSRITSRSSSLLQKGLAVVAISSNSVVTHPQVQMLYNLWSLGFMRPLRNCCEFLHLSQDGPEFMVEDAKLFKYPFPYLYDEVCFSNEFLMIVFNIIACIVYISLSVIIPFLFFIFYGNIFVAGYQCLARFTCSPGQSAITPYFTTIFFYNTGSVLLRISTALVTIHTGSTPAVQIGCWDLACLEAYYFPRCCGALMRLRSWGNAQKYLTLFTETYIIF